MPIDKWARAARQHTFTVLIVTLVLLFSTVISSGIAKAFEDEAGSTGLHDNAGVLDEEEQTRIEQAIAEVEAAGAPTVVYLRLLETDADQAVEDGQRLMEAWAIESAPGARDGFVMFFNLEPDDPAHGSVGIVAGEAHFNEGALPQSELDRIREEMLGELADGNMAEGIVLGLELTEERLIAGPPEPTAFETFVEDVATGPVSLLNGLAIAIAFLLGMIGLRTWRDRPRADNVYEVKATEPPSDLHPALAGSLVKGSVDHTHIEATLIELARRGAIMLEPDPDDEEKARIRILDPNIDTLTFESELLSILQDEAEDGVLDQDALGKTRSKWSDVTRSIREHQEHAGRFEPNAVRNQMPLWIIGGLALLLGFLAFIIPVSILDEGWSLIGGGALFILGAVLIGMAASYPRTTSEGARQAVPWRGYQTGLKEAADREYGAIDLDEAFPYIVALGLTDDFHDHLEQASKAGYVPLWTKATAESQLFASNWFIYWVAFHSTMSYSGGSSVGGVPGGAATGSGGSGGSF